MKGKLVRGNSPRGLFNYLLGRDKKKKNINGRVIGGNMAAREPAALTRIFYKSIQARKKSAKNTVLHIPLRMPKGEDISDAKWVEIARSLMEEMGISKNRPWILVKHTDEHVHLVTSTIDYEGNLWHGHHEILKLIKATNTLEYKFNLTITRTLSDASLDRILNPSGQIYKKERLQATGQPPIPTVRDLLADLIPEAIQQSKGEYKDFARWLAAKNVIAVQVAHTGGEVYGIKFEHQNIELSGYQIARKFTWNRIKSLLDQQKLVSNAAPPPRPKTASTPPEPEPKIEDPIKVRSSQEVVIERVYTQEAVLISKPEIRRSLGDIPAHIDWQPNDNAWPALLDFLLRKYRLDRQLLEELKRKKALWAINSHTLATASRAHDTNKIVGITRMQIDSGPLTPHILLPNQPGLFGSSEKFVPRVM